MYAVIQMLLLLCATGIQQLSMQKDHAHTSHHITSHHITSHHLAPAQPSQILRRRRCDRGALQLASPEVKFKLETDTQDPMDVGMYQVGRRGGVGVKCRGVHSQYMKQTYSACMQGGNKGRR
jgi:hypothetical protein